MAKTKISEFSATPANNTDIDGINIAEGCAPSGINDAIRELMAQLKDWQSGTSNDPYVVGSSGSLTLNQGTANGIPYLNGSKVVTSGSALTFDGTNFATTGSVTSAGSSNSGNLAFTGTGNRITGDFSNATFANRVAFQTSTSNSATTVYAIPNGTSTTSGFIASTDPSVTNGSEIRALVTSTAATLTSSFRGSGTTLPLTFDVGGERMRVDTSGNLGIGTSSPSDTLSYGKALDIQGTLGSALYARSATNSSTVYGVFAYDTNAVRVNIGAVGTNNYLRFITAVGEAARIDSSGNLLVGTTTAVTTNVAGVMFAKVGTQGRMTIGSTSTAAQDLAYFFNPNGIVGSIQTNGSSTSYVTSSDYRLKNTIAPMTGALAKVALLKPCTYKWNVDGSDGEGFIAHELAEVVPQCVTGEKDAVDADGNPKYQGIDTSFLVATLTAALQEAHGLIKDQATAITALTARVAALESN